MCSSLPVEGVSDEDYEDHVYKHHVFPNQSAIKARSGNLRKLMNHQMTEKPNVVAVEQQWSVYSAELNLPAVLNDPNRGKQVILLTNEDVRVVACKIRKCLLMQVVQVPGFFHKEYFVQHYSLHVRGSGRESNLYIFLKLPFSVDTNVTEF